MAGGCCAETSCELKALRKRHAGVLWVVLAVNAAMFIVELVAGMLANSTSLLADSLDMFGDASVYALSIFVLSRSERWRAGAALVKGGLMLVFGLAVLSQAVWRVWHPELPDSRTMGTVGILALAANLTCSALLYRHRGDDLNMRSTWLCSRNDVVANLAVILAACASWFTASRWPDLVVGSGIALLFVNSALGVIGEGRVALGVDAAASG